MGKLARHAISRPAPLASGDFCFQTKVGPKHWMYPKILSCRKVQVWRLVHA